MSASIKPEYSEGSDGEEEGTDFLRSRMTSLNYQTVTDPFGSPTATKRLRILLPPTWKHRDKCGCTICSDMAVERIWLRSHIIEAANRLQQNNVSDGKTMLSMTIKQRERLSTNISAHVSAFGSAICDDHIRGKALQQFAPFAVHQSDFNVLAVILCEAAVLGKDSQQFSSCYSQAEEALQRNYLSFDRSHVYLAELFYIAATPNLLWPPTTQLVPKSKLSSVDILCAGIGRMNVSEVMTPPDATRKSQKPERVVPEVDEMPQQPARDLPKGRRGRSNSSVTAAPVKCRQIALKVSGQSRALGKELVPDDETSTSLPTRNKHKKTCHVQNPSGN